MKAWLTWSKHLNEKLYSLPVHANSRYLRHLWPAHFYRRQDHWRGLVSMKSDPALTKHRHASERSFVSCCRSILRPVSTFAQNLLRYHMQPDLQLYNACHATVPLDLEHLAVGANRITITIIIPWTPKRKKMQRGLIVTYSNHSQEGWDCENLCQRRCQDRQRVYARECHIFHRRDPDRRWRQLFSVYFQVLENRQARTSGDVWIGFQQPGLEGRIQIRECQIK